MDEPTNGRSRTRGASPERLLNVQEAAAMLSLKPATLYGSGTPPAASATGRTSRPRSTSTAAASTFTHTEAGRAAFFNLTVELDQQ